MAKIDIGIYLLLLLMFLIGFSKGFIKQILSIANWFASLILAVLFVKPFSGLMAKTTLQTTINEKVISWIVSKGAIFQIPYDSSNGNAQISEAISEGLKLPKFIADIIAKGINFDVPDGTTLADILGPAIGSLIMTVISFFIIFIGSLIVIKIVISILDLVFDKGVLGLVNRLLGASLGLVKGLILVSLAMLFISILSGVIPSLNQFLINDLRLGEESFSIGKFFYEHNPIVELFKGSFKFDNIFGSLNLF